MALSESSSDSYRVNCLGYCDLHTECPILYFSLFSSRNEFMFHCGKCIDAFENYSLLILFQVELEYEIPSINFQGWPIFNDQGLRTQIEEAISDSFKQDQIENNNTESNSFHRLIEKQNLLQSTYNRHLKMIEIKEIIFNSEISIETKLHELKELIEERQKYLNAIEEELILILVLYQTEKEKYCDGKQQRNLVAQTIASSDLDIPRDTQSDKRELKCSVGFAIYCSYDDILRALEDSPQDLRCLTLELKNQQLNESEWQEILEQLSRFDKLNVLALDFTSTGIGRKEFTILGLSLAKLTNISRLELSLETQSYDQGYVQGVRDLLGNLSNLRYLKLLLQGCSISGNSKGTKDIWEMLAQKLPMLQELVLFSNDNIYFHSEDLSFFQNIRSMKQLSRLTIGFWVYDFNKSNEDKKDLFYSALREIQSNLKHLELYFWKNLSKQEELNIAESLSLLQGLETLRLYKYPYYDESFYSVCEVLTKMKCLQNPYQSFDELTPTDTQMTIIYESLANMTSTERIAFNLRKIDWSDLQILVKGFALLTNLQRIELKFQNSGIEISNIISIIQSISSTTNLSQMHISSNRIYISGHSEETLFKVLSRFKNLIGISLPVKQIIELKHIKDFKKLITASFSELK